MYKQVNYIHFSLAKPKPEPDRFMAVRTYFVFEEVLWTITAERNPTHITILAIKDFNDITNTKIINIFRMKIEFLKICSYKNCIQVYTYQVNK